MFISIKPILTAMALVAVVTLAPANLAYAEEVQASNTEYTVVQGDYLDKIARHFNTTWQKLFDKNTDIKDPNLIFPGQKLAVPKADEAVAPRHVEAPQPAPAPAPVQTPAPAPEPVREAPVAPQAAPAPAPAVVSGGSNCEVARNLINQYSWNKETAYQVMVAESNCNPMAANWNDNHGNCVGSFGLFQINCGYGQLYDPAANVEQAHKMWQASGWQPWGFTTCKTKVVCN